MLKAFWIAIVVGVLFLAGAVLFFWYLKPIWWDHKNLREPVVQSGDVPVGYFDLRNQKEVLVDIQGFDFTPQKIIVSPGTKILWRNDDKMTHSVTFEAGFVGEGIAGGDSGLFKQGEIFTQVLVLPGIYPYHSSDNPGTMKGIVIVK
ncbi:MAG: plastocyanin/azurin family copper-binding protein [bacterium]|nr:plastocyanin/azurin family copper-binding protein [bacterium]